MRAEATVICLLVRARRFISQQFLRHDFSRFFTVRKIKFSDSRKSVVDESVNDAHEVIIQAGIFLLAS